MHVNNESGENLTGEEPCRDPIYRVQCSNESLPTEASSLACRGRLQIPRLNYIMAPAPCSGRRVQCRVDPLRSPLLKDQHRKNSCHDRTQEALENASDALRTASI